MDFNWKVQSLKAKRRVLRWVRSCMKFDFLHAAVTICVLINVIPLSILMVNLLVGNENSTITEPLSVKIVKDDETAPNQFEFTLTYSETVILFIGAGLFIGLVAHIIRYNILVDTRKNWEYLEARISNQVKKVCNVYDNLTHAEEKVEELIERCHKIKRTYDNIMVKEYVAATQDHDELSDSSSVTIESIGTFEILEDNVGSRQSIEVFYETLSSRSDGESESDKEFDYMLATRKETTTESETETERTYFDAQADIELQTDEVLEETKIEPKVADMKTELIEMKEEVAEMEFADLCQAILPELDAINMEFADMMSDIAEIMPKLTEVKSEILEKISEHHYNAELENVIKQSLTEKNAVVVVINSNICETKPELIQMKPELVEIKPEPVEIKQDLVEIKPELVDIKQDLVKIKPGLIELKPELVEIKPELVEKKPELVGIKPEFTDTKSELTEMKPEFVEMKPKSTEVKPEPVEIKPELDEMKPELVEMKPELTYLKPELTNMKSELVEITPVLTDTKPVLSEVKQELVEIIPKITEMKPEIIETKTDLVEIKSETSEIESEMASVELDNVIEAQ